MSITAKYAATCATCHGPVTPGQQIEWTKGQPVRHTACAAGSRPTAAVSTPAKGSCAKCGKACRPQYRTCYDCSPASAGTTYEPGVGRTCDECGDVARKGTRCWETGCMH